MEGTPADTIDTTDGDQMPRWVRRAIFLWWGVLVSLWLALLMARQLRGLLVQVVLALFLSFALEPLVDKMEARGMKRGLATAISLVGLFAAAAAFVTAMGQLIATQLTDLVDEFPRYLTSGQEWLADQGITVETDDLIERFQDGGDAAGYASDVANRLLSAGTTVAGILFQVITVALFTFYFTADGPRLRRVICSMLPPQRQVEVIRVWELAINKTGAYITSRFILALISGVFHWIVFTILDLPSAVALALWVGLISQFIPTLGTYLAGVFPVLVALGIEPSKALWVIAAVVIYQQIENYILQPRITAQTLDLHPAVSIGAVLAGTSLFGAPGALLALPFVATAGGFFTAYVERHPLIENRLLAAKVGLPLGVTHGAETLPDEEHRPDDEASLPSDD